MSVLMTERAVDTRRERVSSRVDVDHDLRAALSRRDPSAAERLIARFSNRAYRLAFGITRNAQDAEEAVQDALLNVTRKIDTFRGDSAFGSWVYRIVANAAYQKLRGRRSRGTEIPLDEVLPSFHEGRASAPAQDWSQILDDPSRTTELRMVLQSAMSEMPDDYRTALVLHDVEGLANTEVAEVLGITVANVKSRTHRARLFLRKRLEEAMVSLAS
jgi:RNA polymerase sigma-70 factor (ECF subfamily)